jgi:hypothetical protein
LATCGAPGGVEAILAILSLATIIADNQPRQPGPIATWITPNKAGEVRVAMSDSFGLSTRVGDLLPLRNGKT